MKLALATGGLILCGMTSKARLFALCVAVFALAGEASAQTAAPQTAAPLAAPVQAAWMRVRAALTPQQQANEVRGFLSALATANGRPTAPALDARDIASGRAVSLDDPALLQRPRRMRSR